MLPPSAEQWVRTHHGDVRRANSLPSTQGRVWRVDTDEVRVAVKQGPRAAIEREVWGLSRAVAVGEVPRLLGRPEPTVVVLSWCEGRGASARLEDAGAWLRRLHALPCRDTDAMAPPEAIERRVASWIERPGSSLSDASRDWVRSAIDPRAFEGVRRVVCHRDFTPSNWLWCPELSVVDFGQARPDVGLWDLVKLEAGLFRQQPSARAAFFRGYGELTSLDEVRLRQLVLLHGLQTAVWGDIHDDAELAAHGRDVLGAFEKP